MDYRLHENVASFYSMQSWGVLQPTNIDKKPSCR